MSPMLYRASWAYHVSADRRTRLTANCPSYPDIVDQIATAIVPAEIQFLIDPGYLVPINGAVRPLFYADVNPELADCFFNGVGGYRAQYYDSPATGLEANRYSLGKLEAKLFEAADKKNLTYVLRNERGEQIRLTMDEEQLYKSLRLPSAKIWGDESEGEMQSITRENQDTTAQICAPRWLEYATAGNQKAKKGIKAPIPKRLKFHGAFLKNGEEAIPPGKITRSDDIFLWGWS